MNEARSAGSRPPRLWPGVALLILQWLARFGAPVVSPEHAPFGILGGVGFGLLLLVWWLFFSRVPHRERWGALALVVALAGLLSYTLHPSIAHGMMGLMYPIFAIPGICLALVLWAALSRRWTTGPRFAALAALTLVACGTWSLLRIEGITGAAGALYHWRWTPTAEQRLLARADEAPHPGTPPTLTAFSWGGFRGTDRNGVAATPRLSADPQSPPPKELWRRPVGPGWSSFAGDLASIVCTQEQRGEDEVVRCYRTSTGELVWTHADRTRFWEANAGAGPRATPTWNAGRLYTLGATGIVNALDAGDGSVVWSSDAGEDSGVEVPYWGFSGSPLIVDAAGGDLAAGEAVEPDPLVVVAASGTLVAYDLQTGAIRWKGANAGSGYSSPLAATFAGVPQIVQLGSAAAIGVAPSDGAVLWRYDWPSGERIVQPNLTADGDLLIAGGANEGLRRVRVTRSADGVWSAEQVWETRGLKPYFNDFVVYEGHAYGFDGAILACIDLDDGARAWKGGRYGRGPLMLAADPGLLVVLSETGEIALVRASPDGFEELMRRPAIEGKSWNHPALLDDVLLVRNDREMAAFRLARASD